MWYFDKENGRIINLAECFIIEIEGYGQNYSLMAYKNRLDREKGINIIIAICDDIQAAEFKLKELHRELNERRQAWK